MERVNSYNPGACTGPTVCLVWCNWPMKLLSNTSNILLWYFYCQKS